MGRIGNFFRNVGKGMKKVGQGIWTGAKWVGNNVIRPVAKIISHPATQALLSNLGPKGQIIGSIGSAVNGAINIYDGIKGEPPKVS
jgi:hypothetical protein